MTGKGARAEILDRLSRVYQTERPLFRGHTTRVTRRVPPEPVASTEGDSPTLASVFGERLAALSGSYEIAERRSEVAELVKQRVMDWAPSHATRPVDGAITRVLSWSPDELPISNLSASLRAAGIELVVPGDLSDRDARQRAAGVEIGLTGVDAAFAATGSIVLAPGAGRSRAASLLPLLHIVLIPSGRLYPTFETWLGELRAAGQLTTFTRQSRQLVFVTGPSKSADIELSLTLGVHGPRTVHAILFDDS